MEHQSRHQMKVGDELKKRLAIEGIESSNIISFETSNDKKKRKIITKLLLIDGSTYELIDDFIWYAARKNKKW